MLDLKPALGGMRHFGLNPRLGAVHRSMAFLFLPLRQGLRVLGRTHPALASGFPLVSESGPCVLGLSSIWVTSIMCLGCLTPREAEAGSQGSGSTDLPCDLNKSPPSSGLTSE